MNARFRIAIHNVGDQCHWAIDSTVLGFGKDCRKLSSPAINSWTPDRRLGLIQDDGSSSMPSMRVCDGLTSIWRTRPENSEFAIASNCD